MTSKEIKQYAIMLYLIPLEDTAKGQNFYRNLVYDDEDEASCK